MTSNKRLSWGLLIATRNRTDVLYMTVRLALKQTRPPSEIIVIDSGESATVNAVEIRKIVDESQVSVTLTCRYHPVPSTACQRNVAIGESKADVVFLLDDDSFMYPDCAEQIMRVYELDVNREISGVQAALVEDPPLGIQPTGPRKEHGQSASFAAYSPGLIGRARSWLGAHVFLLGHHDFVRYDASIQESRIPSSLEGVTVSPVNFLHGCRMTFRREELAKEGFESSLRYSSTNEDLDASYRMRRHGALVEVSAARLHHFEAAGGRPKRFLQANLTMLNRAAMVRKHGPDQNYAQRAYWIMFGRIVFAELLKETLVRRWTFPQLRGVLQAWGDARRLFRMSPTEVDEVYPAIQERLIKGR